MCVTFGTIPTVLFYLVLYHTESSLVTKKCLICVSTYVTESDKIGLIAVKYMCLLNNVYLHICVRYNNLVSFSKISIKFYRSGETFE